MNGNKSCIIADPKGNSWEFACKIQDILKKKSNDFELNELEIKRFADGEYLTKIKHNIRKRNCFYIHDANLKPSEWFTTLCMVNHTLKTSAANEIIDVMPYMRFTRQDKKDESRVPITPVLIADNAKTYIDRVMTVDVHNPSIAGFFNPVSFDNLYSFQITTDYLKEKHPEILKDVTIMSPDAGGTARARAFAKRAGTKDIAIGYKFRETAGTVSSLEVLGDVSGRNVLIVDDMIDSGGTLVKAVEAARKKGAKKVYAYATHGLFTKGINHIVDAVDGLFVGDTLKQESHPKLHIISFAELFAEAIYRTHIGESLSELFE